MIKLPYDKKDTAIAGGIRLGTPIVTKRAMGLKEMDTISALIDTILKNVKMVSDSQYCIEESFKNEIRGKVKDLCSKFPLY